MDNKSLDALFSGLTVNGNKVPAEQSTTQRKKGSKSETPRDKQKRQEKERQEERFCTIVNSEILKKVRIIATREGLQIKDVVEAAFEKAIGNYERKHGKIEEDPKKNVKDLF